MIGGAVETTLAGEVVALLAARALFWPRERTLFVADPHFGKSASFRARGIFVPRGTTTATLERLDIAITRCDPQRVVFLGDFFHSRASQAERTLATIATWRDRHRARTMALVGGNHDRHAGPPPAALGIDELAAVSVIAPFVLSHEPLESSSGYVLAGHTHPAYLLSGRAGQSLRLPCFWVMPHCTVLPALGAFTGGALIEPGQRDQVFVIADDRVFAVPMVVGGA